MIAVHPGRILKREMVARNLSANQLALSLRIPSGRITEILGAQRGISANTALRLGRYFGNSPRFWASLQTAFDLAEEARHKGERIAAEVLPAASA